MPDDPTPLHEALELRLTQAAGRSATLLSETRTALRDRPGFHDALIMFMGRPSSELSDGASWILKAELEVGWRISTAQIAQVLDLLPQLSAWPTCLHLLQSIDMLPLAPGERRKFETWAKVLLQHKRPLIRAWAVHACVRLAPDANTTARILNAADTDPAASVRARARRLRAEL